MLANYSQNSVLRSPQHINQSPGYQKSQQSSNRQGQQPTGRITSRRNPLIGKSVRITKGPYKTHTGIVKATTDSTARVELTSEYKTINVDLARIAPLEQPHHDVINPSASTWWNTPNNPSGGATLAAQTPRGTSATPLHDGSRTPRFGNQTPRFGGQTPSHMTPLR